MLNDTLLHLLHCQTVRNKIKKPIDPCHAPTITKVVVHTAEHMTQKVSHTNIFAHLALHLGARFTPILKMTVEIKIEKTCQKTNSLGYVRSKACPQSKTKVYCNRKLLDAAAEIKTSKGLALKWFHEWKQFQKIQPSKSYAQALILGREMNLDPAHPQTSQSSVPKKQVSVNQKRYRYMTCQNNNQTATIQTNASGGSKSGGSVAGASRARSTLVQIHLTNRFQVLQDKLSDEFEDQQWGQTSSDRSKQAKSHKSNKVTSNSTTVKTKVHKFHSPKQLQTTVFQKSQASESLPYSPKNLNRDDVIVDTDSHMTDYPLAINGNSEPDNNSFSQSSSQDMENVLGTVNPGMCLDQQKCIQQTGGYFGFVPQTSLKTYKGTPVNWEKIPSILEAHHLVKNSGTHNYLKCRIPVNSHLKIHNWTHFLKDYWDQQIVDLLHYGFPLDFNRNSPLTSTHDNHKSAITDVDHVKRFVKEEFSTKQLWDLLTQYPSTSIYLL